MSWNAKKAQTQTVQPQQQQPSQLSVTINGQRVNASVEQISQLIKERFKKSPSIHSLFDEFDMSLERLDDLLIEVVPLEKKYAETDSNSIRLNTMLFETGDFFKDYFFVVSHELVHWLSRKKEEEAYFNDPEEVLGFVASVAHELESQTDPDIMWNKIYPKISWHFSNEHDAREFFVNMIDRAKKLIAEGANNVRGK